MLITFVRPTLFVRHTQCCFKKLMFLCLFIGWQISFVQAESTDQVITLNTALKRAIEQNPGLKVFEFRNAALNGQMKMAGLKPAYELGVLDAQRQVESLALLGDVTRRYVDVLATQEQVSLAKEANALAAETLSIVRKRAKAGAIPDAEVKRALAAAAQAQLTLLSTQQQLDYLKVSLAALWGDAAPNFSSVEGDLYYFGTDVEFKTLFAKMESNPAIQIFAAEERLRDAGVRLAKTQSKADISWSVGMRRFQASDDAALVAGFSMPLFSSKRNSGAVSTALAQRNEITVQKEVALLNMHTQLFRAFHNRRQAIIATKELQGTIIPALSDALKETRLAYQRGRYGYLEYVSSRQELLNARRTLIESASSALTYAAEIEQLTAEPLSATQYGESIEFSGSVR